MSDSVSMCPRFSICLAHSKTHPDIFPVSILDIQLVSVPWVLFLSTEYKIQTFRTEHPSGRARRHSPPNPRGDQGAIALRAQRVGLHSPRSPRKQSATAFRAPGESRAPQPSEPQRVGRHSPWSPRKQRPQPSKPQRRAGRHSPPSPSVTETPT